MRTFLAAALTAVALTAAGAAPAAADDAALRQVMNGQTCNLEPAFERFQRASSNVRLGDSREQMRRALQPLKHATSAVEAVLQRCAGAVRRQRTSTQAGASAQLLLVDGSLTMRDGLDVYGIFFELVDAATRARSEAEARRTLRPLPAVLRTFKRIFLRGATAVEDAARMIEQR